MSFKTKQLIGFILKTFVSIDYKNDKMRARICKKCRKFLAYKAKNAVLQKIACFFGLINS